MQDFKRVLKPIFGSMLCGLILLGILVAGSFWLMQEVRKHPERLPDRSRTIVELENESPHTLDILFLGDSLSYCSFSPMQLWTQYGIASFSGTQSAQNIQEAFYMLKTALKTQHPKVVVLETNTVFRERKGLSGVSDTFSTWGNYYLPAIGYHDVWKTYLSKKRYAMLDYKGFVLRDLIAPYTGGEYMKKSSKISPISKSNEWYLNRIHELCQQHHIDLMLVSAPSPINYNFAKHNALKAFARHEKLTYIDLNLQVDALKINWKQDSLDNGDHLNLRGAEKVTSYFGKKLSELYQFTDHRQEAKYEFWNTQAKQYQREFIDKKKEMEKKERITVG